MRTEKSPTRMACRTWRSSYPNDAAPLPVLREPCSKLISVEPARDSAASSTGCILVPSRKITAHQNARARHEKMSAISLGGSGGPDILPHLEQARWLPALHPDQNAKHPKRFLDNEKFHAFSRCLETPKTCSII